MDFLLFFLARSCLQPYLSWSLTYPKKHYIGDYIQDYIREY